MAARWCNVAAHAVASAWPPRLPESKQDPSRDLGYNKRLHYRRQFLPFFDGAEVFRLSQCVVFRIPNDLGHFRLGITLKARGSSVERNRTKRQVRESMRRLGVDLGSYDYNVVIPGHRKLSRPYPERLGLCLKGELGRALGAPSR